MRRLFVATCLLALIACSSKNDAGTTPSDGVASIAVVLASSSLTVGNATTASATLRDGSGAMLTGRTVTWSSSAPSVATVDATGLVTAVAEGSATISASSEGKVGSAAITVTAVPVATVTVNGAARVKAGEDYQYTAQLRTATGQLVIRPVTWSIVSGPATVSAAGVLRATGNGTVAVRATAEGVIGTGAVTAYDWQVITGSGTIQVALPADVAVTNKFGQSEYPILGVGCGSGYFIVYVGFQNFVTANGIVSYAFDTGAPVSATWIEGSSFDVLGHPGPTNLATKTFAATIAAARQFSFAFGEFNGTAKATMFRVTGLTQAMAPVLQACPSNAVMDPGGRILAPGDLVDRLARVAASWPR